MVRGPAERRRLGRGVRGGRPGAVHNDARDQVREELLTLLVEKHDGESVPLDLLRKALEQDRELAAAFDRAWPLLDAAELVGDLWSVPAYLRMAAPWLTRDEVRLLQRSDAQAWTVADLPVLDAARRRVGDPEAWRRRRRQEAAVAAERAGMAQVIDSLLADETLADADVDSEGALVMLHGQDMKDTLVDPTASTGAEPDRLAGRSRTSSWTRRRS